MVNRRQFVKGASIAGLAGIAGCTGQQGQQDTATETEGQETPSGGTATPGGGTATPKPEGPAVTDEEVHILTDYSNNAWQKTWEKNVVPNFEDETGIPLNVEYVGFQGTGEQRLITLMQAGNAPESFTGNIDQVGDLFIQGQLQPVNEPVKAIEENMGEVIAPQVTVQGKNYVIPHGIYTSTVHHRRDILEQLNLDPPETWSGLRNAAKAISEDSSIEARGFAVSAAKAGMSTSYFDLFYLTNGAWKWTGAEDGGIEVTFPEDKAIETVEYLNQMSEYSPDPASVNWGSTLKFWAAERVAMMYHLNAWGAGVAANAGNVPVAKNSGIVPMPHPEGVEPLAQSSVTIDGHPVLSVADNVGGMFELAKYMYRSPEAASQYYLNEPTRFIPAYNDVFEAEAYQSADIFQKVPNLLDLNLKARDEMAPLAVDPEEIPDTKATIYAGRFPIFAEMMNQVIVAGRPPKPAVKEAKDRWLKRLEEGRKK